MVAVSGGVGDGFLQSETCSSRIRHEITELMQENREEKAISEKEEGRNYARELERHYDDRRHREDRD